ncbi:MAG TPA: carcinine hydrolase/isopenicillin-N N-acyltransferase family protein, partial [Labilithrix sp.]
EAAAILAKQPVMVSQMVFVGDARGRFVVVERAPGAEATIRDARALTNHFEGPLASDPANERVRQTTTTLARRARIDELLANVRGADVPQAIAMLRDHRCAGGEACPPGDRRAIDAFIATHGVVFDLTTRTAWVSEGPHLSGKFARVDLAAAPDAPLSELPEDPALTDGRYAEGRTRAGGPMIKERP